MRSFKLDIFWVVPSHDYSFTDKQCLKPPDQKKKTPSLSLGSLGCLDKINYIDSRRLTSISTNSRPWRCASLLKTSVPSPPVQRLLLLPVGGAVDVAPGHLKEPVQKNEMVDSCVLKSRSKRWFNRDLRLCIMLIMIGHISSTSILHWRNTQFHTAGR